MVVGVGDKGPLEMRWGTNNKKDLVLGQQFCIPVGPFEIAGKLHN